MVVSLIIVRLSYTYQTNIIKFAHKFFKIQRHVKRFISIDTKNKVFSIGNICRFNEDQNQIFKTKNHWD
jgi:hypothetical protein